MQFAEKIYIFCKNSLFLFVKAPRRKYFSPLAPADAAGRAGGNTVEACKDGPLASAKTAAQVCGWQLADTAKPAITRAASRGAVCSGDVPRPPARAGGFSFPLRFTATFFAAQPADTVCTLCAVCANQIRRRIFTLCSAAALPAPNRPGGSCHPPAFCWKSVHKDVTGRLRLVDPTLWRQVAGILSKNKEERHLRGGLATRHKYHPEADQPPCDF